MAAPTTLVPKPKEWGPQHERMALFSASGMRNKEIAELFEVSETWVGIVLQDPRAIKVKDGFLRELRDRLLSKHEDQVLALAEYALKNLGRTLKEHVDPEKLGKKQHQDRMSLEIMKMAGLGYTERGGGGPTLTLTREESELLMDAVKKSDRAREIHEGSYEVIDDEPDGKGEVAD